MPAGKQNPKWQRTVLLATDNSQSVIGELADGKTNLIGYSAYGEQSSKQEVSTQLAFTGQLCESNIGWYLLGNGYRAYNPRLMRFHSPDSWSPFGRGGLNAYMYCVGDPVNRSDPKGHASLFSWLPLGLRKFASGVDKFFFGGPSVTGPSRTQSLDASDPLGPMQPEKTGELKSLIGAGTIVGGAPGPRGNRSPAIQYVEATPKHHPGYVDGALADGLTPVGNLQKTSSSHNKAVHGVINRSSTQTGRQVSTQKPSQLHSLMYAAQQLPITPCPPPTYTETMQQMLFEKIRAS